MVHFFRLKMLCIFRILCTVTVLLVVNPVAWSAPAGEENVFPQGRFDLIQDEETKPGAPVGSSLPKTWKLWSRRQLKQVALVDDEGNRWLRIVNGDGKQSVGLMSRLKLQPSWKYLTVSAKMTTKDLQRGREVWQTARISLTFENDQKQRVGTYTAVPELNADSPWQDVGVELTVPQGATYLKVEPGLYNATGELGIDDIQIAAEDKVPSAVGGTFPNGAFDAMRSKAKLLSLWHLWRPQDNAQVNLEHDVDNRWLEISNNDTTKSVGVVARLKLDPSWKRVVIKTKMAARELKTGKAEWQTARIALQFEDAQNKKVGAFPPTLNVAEDTPWKSMELEIAVPQGVTYLKMEPGLYNATGVLGLDDITVTGDEKEAKVAPNKLSPDALPIVEAKGSSAGTPRLGPSLLKSIPTQTVFGAGHFDAALLRNGVPQGWEIAAADKARILTLDEEGNRFLILTNRDATKAVSLTARLKIKPEWKSLHIKVRLAAESLHVGKEWWHNARIALRFEDQNGVKMGELPPAISLSKSAPWQVLETDITIPANAAYLKVQPGLFFATGTFKVDDILITSR